MKRLHNIEFVYMGSIIIDLGVLLSVTKHDDSSLKKLGEICQENHNFHSIKLDVNSFLNKYKKTSGKIEANRNRLLSHIDISDKKSFHMMTFSNIETDENLKKYGAINRDTGEIIHKTLFEAIDKMRTKEKSNNTFSAERYGILDFREDIPKFISILEEVRKIVFDTLTICHHHKML